MWLCSGKIAINTSFFKGFFSAGTPGTNPELSVVFHKTRAIPAGVLSWMPRFASACGAPQKGTGRFPPKDCFRRLPEKEYKYKFFCVVPAEQICYK